MHTPESSAKNCRKKAQETQKINWFFSLLFLSFLCIFAANLAFAKYSGGTGTPVDPYQIGDVNDLLLLGEETGDYDKYFILTNDINLAGYIFTTAVIAPDGPYHFTGIFDGDDHKIRNLTINGDSGLGLFGYIYTDYTDPDGCEVKNLGLENVYINSDQFLGGSIGGLVGGNTDAIIRNCYSKGVVAGGINCHNVGGLVGINYGAIINCYSEGVVTSAGAFQYPGSAGIGGLVGVNTSDFETNGSIIYSWSSCDVIGGDGAGDLGGLAGGNSGEFGSIISNCFSTGTVRGYNSGGLGGLVGGCYKSLISKCFSTGPVIGEGATNGIGGLVGGNGAYSEISNCFSTGDVNTGSNSQKVGGFVGSNESYGAVAKIINCYSAGDVNAGSGSSYVGGMVGYDYYGEITSSYFLDISGPNNNLGTPLTDSEMKQQASFVVWDFVLEMLNGSGDVWSIKEDVNYPVLVWPLVNLKWSKYPFVWYEVDLTDFATMGNWWGHTDCADVNDCNKADFDLSGRMDLYDLDIFCKFWLQGTTFQ